jgi:elongation factor P
MFTAVDLRKGTKVLFRSDPYEVIDFMHSIRGRGRGKVWLKMKNMRTGSVHEESYSSEEPFDAPDLETRNMQYLYSDPENYTFMDLVTYDQLVFPKDTIGDSKWFLKEGESYVVMLFEENPLTIDLPASYILKIAETEPAMKGDTVSNVTKKATLETGLVIKVPLFIQIGESVKVDTRSLEYQGRA